MATAGSTPQSPPEGKSKERKIYPMTEEIYERGEEVFSQTLRNLERLKEAGLLPRGRSSYLEYSEALKKEEELKRAQQAAAGEQQQG